MTGLSCISFPLGYGGVSIQKKCKIIVMRKTDISSVYSVLLTKYCSRC